MFSRSKNKNEKEKKKRDPNQRRNDLTQFGLLEIPDIASFSHGTNEDDDEDDAALEAELLSLTTGNKGRSKPKRTKCAAPTQNLDSMVSECMRDDLDEDISDCEDPDLLDELSFLVSNDAGEEEDEENTPSTVTSASASSVTPPEALSPVRHPPPPMIVRPSPVTAGHSVLALLQERIIMYKEAEDNALASGETSRARRFTRGLKTLNQMLKNVHSGRAIDENDIPPAVLANSSRSNSTVNLNQEDDSKTQPLMNVTPTLVDSTISHDVAFGGGGADRDISLGKNEIEGPPNSSLIAILQRQSEYKVAALDAKKRGDKESAIHFLKISKQLDPLVEASTKGLDVDLSSLPASPSSVASTGSFNQEEVPVHNSPPVNSAEPGAANDSSTGPSQPQSILEALEQRLAKYIEQKDKALNDGNTRKERMNQRICKQYQEAIKLHKMGRYVDFEELPTPPGFVQISVKSGAPPQPPPAPFPSEEAPSVPKSLSSSALPPQPSSQKDPQEASSTAPTRPPRKAPPPPINVRSAPQSRVERQVSLLKKRQQQFREAALDAKKRGEIEQAKEYLRNSKGFEQLILASQGGLPVDMNTIPIPPQEAVASFNTSCEFEVIDKDDCHAPATSTPSDIALAYTKLEDDLIEQIKMCAHTREHFKALGDVASANRFEQLILHTKKDLDAVRVAFKRGDTPPRFHYETRSFTLIQCNTDLNDSDLEVTIICGINFNVPNPKEIDTCVKLEFPYPTEAPPQEKTDVIKDTNCPEYNHKVIFSIDRKSRALARIFKRQSIKCYVLAKGKWFHRDSVIGTVKVPLVSLENQCTLHESYDLLDEKKKMVGGKLEVKVRLRNPILTKQLEKVTKKWLVIDGF